MGSMAGLHSTETRILLSRIEPRLPGYPASSLVSIQTEPSRLPLSWWESKWNQPDNIYSVLWRSDLRLERHAQPPHFIQFVRESSLCFCAVCSQSAVKRWVDPVLMRPRQSEPCSCWWGLHVVILMMSALVIRKLVPPSLTNTGYENVQEKILPGCNAGFTWSRVIRLLYRYINCWDDVLWSDTRVRLFVLQFLISFIWPLPLSFTCLEFRTIYSWPIVTESIYLACQPDKRRVIIFLRIQ